MFKTIIMANGWDYGIDGINNIGSNVTYMNINH